MMDALLVNLTFYVRNAKKMINDNKLTEGNSDTFAFGIDEFTHKQSLEARMKLLNFIQDATDGEIKITAE